MKSSVPAALLCLAASAVTAQTSYDVSGTSPGVSSSTYLALGDSHVFIDLNAEHTLPDNGTPLAGMTGSCIGYMEIALGQGADGQGVCTWTDAEGDMWFGPWTVTGMNAQQVATGRWISAGGTGKFAGMQGGGTFSSMTDPASGEVSLDVSGTVTLQ